MKKLSVFVVLFSIYLNLIAPIAGLNRAYAQKINPYMNQNLPNGLSFRLSEGVEGAEKRSVPTTSETSSLDEAATKKLLSRVPELKGDPADQTDFSKRAGSLPVPKNGKMTQVKFPAAEAAPTPGTQAAKLPLEIVRFTPDGEVSLAPDLTVTFSRAMVPVTSQEIAAQTVPIKLTPNVEGKWRWLGANTLMFDTTKRFPMATEFTATVPAGTKSVNGEVLPKDFSWKFGTPPPKATQMFPQNSSVKRDSVVFIAFDQEIDPEAMLRSITVTGAGKAMSIRLANQAEIDGDNSVSYYAKQAEPRRWLAFRALNSDGSPDNALPSDSQIVVQIAKGAPSAEGPRVTSAAQSFNFRTFAPFKLVKARCGWNDKKRCSPQEDFYIEFNNAIDTDAFNTELVSIEPKIEGANIFPSGNYIYVRGSKKSKTAYKVTLRKGLKDSFGQTLDKDVAVTLNVGTSEPQFWGDGGAMVVLDPSSTSSYSFYSINHHSARVKIYAVQPQDWKQYQDYFRVLNYDDGSKKPAIPGRLVVDKIVNIENKLDEMVETRIDLSEALKNGFGSAIIDIEPTLKRDKYDRTRLFSWVQSTQIGIEAAVDNQELVAYVSDLKTGKALNNAIVSIYPNGDAVSENETVEVAPGVIERVWNYLSGWGSSVDESAATNDDGTEAQTKKIEKTGSRTDDSGVVRLQLPAASANQQNVLIVKRGDDVAFLPENPDYYWQQHGGWHKKQDYKHLRWFVFDDRKMYKPKEEVSVKGYVRIITPGKLGDVEALGDESRKFTWTARDPRGNEIAKGEGQFNAFGAFDLKFKLADNANLGNANITFEAANTIVGYQFSHQFQIQEFRRPEYEVKANVVSEAPFFVGGEATVAVEAKYYAGGGLPNAKVQWNVSAAATSYTPPNRDDFTFGTWTPWWYSRGYYGGYSSPSYQNFSGVTDAAGKHLLKLNFDSANPPRPYSVVANASVQDVNRQTWASRTTLLVHPSDVYVGIRTPRTFVQKGEKLNIESIATNVDGKAVAGRDVKISAVLKDWVYEKNQWIQKTVDEQNCTVKSAEEAVKCEFTAKAGGVYTVSAQVFDDRERPNESTLTVWVPGGKTPPNRNVEQENAQIIPSKKLYEAGEIAEILVISPFANAEGVLTLRRDGILRTERFTIKDSSITLKIPIEEKYLPNLFAHVKLVGAADRDLTGDDAKAVADARTKDKTIKIAKRPAFAAGEISIPVSTASRVLVVEANPRETALEPGAQTKIDVSVRDYKGKAVANSEVAVIAVDESVLALTGYSISDPLGTFYTPRGSGTSDYSNRQQILLGNR